MYVLTWMGFNCDGIQRLRRGIQHVLNDRLRRGPLVRWRFIATRPVQLQCGLLFSINYFFRLRRHGWHLHCVRRRLRVRWRCVNANTMCV